MFMDKYTSIFSRNLEAIVVIILQIFCNVCEKCLRTAYCVGCFPLSVFWYDYMNKRIFPSSVTSIKRSLVLN